MSDNPSTETGVRMKTIGDFLRARILPLPEESLDMRETPYLFLDNMRIVKEIWGWKIFYTKSGRKKEEFLECRSEEEARYLKALIDSGLREIPVPKDDEYLKSILPELERVKARIDEILHQYMDTIRDRSAREQLRREVYEDCVK